jgi:hypothetical protein
MCAASSKIPPYATTQSGGTAAYPANLPTKHSAR